MTSRLADLQACLEGVIPSVVATAAPDGTPNISYLSHVVMVDADHVALSNQFFSKTVANVRANPEAALLLVDARSGAQFRLDVTFERSADAGAMFNQVQSQLQATSAQVGMSGIMRLRAVDIYRVRSIRPVPSPVAAAVPATAATSSHLAAAASLVETIAEQTDVGGIVDAALDGLGARFGYGNLLILLYDPFRGLLTTVGSRGYDRAGIGSEVPIGEGVIGAAASDRRAVKVSDMSRIRRFGAAIRNSSAEENRTRTIVLPGMPDAMSQIGIPMIAHGTVHGVLFAESRERLAFAVEDEAALTIVARQAAAALALAEILAGEPQAPAPAEPVGRPSGRSFRVVHHVFDDSIFIDNEYVIKGVPGRLLMFMLERHRREGRSDFTNREIRLSDALRLPDVKDNLETRLLLLRRRLEEKASPVRLVRTGRGRIRLELLGIPTLEIAGE